MGTWMPKTCERREINKYIKQNCAPSWIYLRDYTEMHGQQNIKKPHTMFKNPNLKYSYNYAYIDVKSEHLKKFT